MEFLSEITWVDLLVVLLLAVGALIGWTQGFMRYLLASAAVLIAFVVAALLKGQATEILGIWSAFTPAIREMLIFLILFVLIVVGLWFAIRAVGEALRLNLPRLVDELAGALTGILFVAMFVVFAALVFDTYYTLPQAAGLAGSVERAQAPGLRAFYEVLNDSILVGFLRDALTPTVGLLARPFVPDDVRAVL